MNPLTPYLLWIKLGAAVALVAGLVGWHAHKVSQARDEGYSTAISERAAQDLTAIVSRTVENKVIADTQHNINVAITKAKNEELAPVRARIAADRVRVGPTLCDGTATPPAPEGARGSDGPNSGAGLLSPGMDRDIRALILETEEVAATARACQRFVRENGLVP